MLGQRSIDDFDANEYTICPTCGSNKVVSTVVNQGTVK
jgi:transcription elongation factor Elf1